MNPIFIFAAVVWLAVSFADAILTNKVVALGGVERNPLLGEKPRPVTVWLFAAATSLGFLAIAYWVVIPKADVHVASFFLAVGSLARSFVVLHNAKSFAKQQKAHVK